MLNCPLSAAAIVDTGSCGRLEREGGTGTITVALYKGSVTFASASEVPHSLYSEENASMEAIGEFDHADSEGFLRVLSVSARALAAAGQVRR